MPPEPAVTLFERLRDSALLEPSRLDELAVLPEAKSSDPRVLGRVLVQRGLLTKFQVTLLAQGKAKDLILGPYRLLDRLGEGAMGAVYKAQHQHMNRVVALKLIRKEKLKSPDAVKRFYQEVQSAARLQHPNIVLAFDGGQVGNAHFLAMEYVPGIDLARLVKENGALPVARACEYLRQAALGLQHAHEAGMVHRDIKPHNLLLSRGTKSGDVVKILDFGLARLSDLSDSDRVLTQTGAVIGTPDYLAPEQALNSRSADIRSDLYSLGCTLFFLLAGRAPFRAEALTQLLLKHQMDQPTPLGEVRADVPPELDAVVMKLLAKNPDDRYQTPAELAEDLEPFARGEDNPVPEVSLGDDLGEEMGGSWTAATNEVGKGRGAKVSLSGSRSGTRVDAAVVAKPRSGVKEKPAAANDKKQFVLLIAGAGGGVLVLLTAIIVGVVLILNSGKPTNSQVAEGPTKPVDVPPTRSDTRPTPPDTKPFKPPEPLSEPRLIAALAPLPNQPGDRSLGLLHAGFINGGDHVIGFTQHTFAVWETEKGTVVSSFGINDRVKHAAGLPDGKRVMLSGRTVTFREMKDGSGGRQLGPFQAPVSNTALSRDGSRIALTAPEMSLSPEGKPLLGADSKVIYRETAVRVYDVSTGNEIGRFEGHKQPVTFIALLAGGRLGFSWSAEGTTGTGMLWDVSNGKELRRIAADQLPKNMGWMTITPDEKTLIVATFDGLIFRSLEIDKEVRRLPLEDGHILWLDISPGGRYLLTGHMETPPLNGPPPMTYPSMRLWDLQTGKVIRSFDHPGPQVTRVAFSPDGRRAVSVSKDGIGRIWDLGVTDPAKPGVRPQ